jgi:hypothetical protein
MITHLFRRFMLLCLILLVPLQGLAIRTAHACPLQKVTHQVRLVQEVHPGPAVSPASTVDRSSADRVLPGQVCVSHGSIAWIAMEGSQMHPPVLQISRLQPAAAYRFSSFISRQPQRPPLFLSA